MESWEEAEEAPGLPGRRGLRRHHGVLGGGA